MHDSELREMVRDAVARRMAHEAGARVEPGPASPFDQRHGSHLLLPVPSGSEGDGACLIEPSVRCNHCGYCLSYGH